MTESVIDILPIEDNTSDLELTMHTLKNTILPTTSKVDGLQLSGALNSDERTHDIPVIILT